jgi:acetamidase/formamidase
VASNITRDWLMSAQGLTEDEAYTVMTTGIDFAVTQVVDQVRCRQIMDLSSAMQSLSEAAYRGQS